MGANFEHEFDLRRKTQLELDDLLASHKTLERSLEDAHARIAAVEQHGFDVEKELESLKKEKKFAEAQLKEVEQVSSTLRGDVGVHGEKVASLTSTIAKLREELAESRKSKAEIEDELKQTKTAHDSLQGKYRTTHDELESALESTSTLESSLDELRRSKAELEKLFQTALLRLKASEKRNTVHKA
jgi:chromosome segregation ATPase